MRKHAPLAAVVALCGIAVVALWANRTYGPEPRPRDVLTVHELSLCISRYAGEHGQPKQMSNREVADLLLDAGYIQPKHVTDGEIRDWWDTPYAIFLASDPERFPDTTLEINGQSVRPVAGLRPLMHQVISAGPDQEFGTSDDVFSWE